MEYLSAANMKKMTDKRNEEINEEIREKVQEKMLDATKKGYYGVTIETLPVPIVKELKNMGYEITFKSDRLEGSGITISWRK